MSEHISANGISMAYALDGPADAPTVMFSTSLMCDYRMWDKQVAALAPDYRVLRYDTRGHGRSEATTGPYTLDLLADDVAALLAALDIKTAHFVGLSLGWIYRSGVGLQASRCCCVACVVRHRLPDAAGIDVGRAH